MRLAADTNRLIDLLRGVDEVVTNFEQADIIMIPWVCIAELRAGFQLTTRTHEQERQLQRLLNQPGVTSLYPDQGTTHQYARLYAQLKKQRTPIGMHDIWIAGLVLQYDLVLYTRDQDFKHLPQIPLLD